MESSMQFIIGHAWQIIAAYYIFFLIVVGFIIYKEAKDQDIGPALHVLIWLAILPIMAVITLLGLFFAGLHEFCNLIFGDRQ